MSDKGRFQNGRWSPRFKSGDVVAFVESENDIKTDGNSIGYMGNHNSLIEWANEIKDSYPKGPFVVTKFTESKFGDWIELSVTTGESRSGATWLFKIVDSQETQPNTSKYRTSFDGFQTCDENWEPGKWLI